MKKKYNLREVFNNTSILLYDLSYDEFIILQEYFNRIFFNKIRTSNYLAAKYVGQSSFYCFNISPILFLNNGKEVVLSIKEIVENKKYTFIKFSDIDLNYFLDNTNLPKKWILERNKQNYNVVNDFINLAYANCGIKKKLSSDSNYLRNKLNITEYIHFSGEPSKNEPTVKSYKMNGYTLITNEEFFSHIDYLYKRYVSLNKYVSEYILEKYKEGKTINLTHVLTNKTYSFNIRRIPVNFRIKEFKLENYIINHKLF